MKKLTFIDDKGTRVNLELDTILQLKNYLKKKPNTVVAINTDYMRNSHRFRFDLLHGLDIRHLLILSCYSRSDDLTGLYSCRNMRNLSTWLSRPDIHLDFSHFKNLQVLEYRWSKETRGLFGCKSLKNLRLWKYKSKTHDLAEFSPLAHLVSLSVNESNIKTLQGLENLTKLKDLTIAYDRLLTLKDMGPLPHVENLHIEGCKNVGLDFVRVFPNLKKLEIQNNGEIESLRPLLDGLKKLKDLHIGGTKIREADNRYWLDYKHIKRFYFVSGRHHVMNTSAFLKYKLVMPSTDPFLVNGKREMAIVLEADAERRISMKALVGAVLEAFMIQKMVSDPKIFVLVVRINGEIDRERFVQEWRRQLRGRKTIPVVAKAFLDNVVKIVDATHYPSDGDPIRFDLMD